MLAPPFARDVGQERAGGARVADAGVVEAAHDGQLVLEGSQRLHDRRELEAGAGRLRRPVLHDHAHRHVDAAEAHAVRRRGRLADGGQRRHHAVKQRQRERRANPRAGWSGG